MEPASIDPALGIILAFALILLNGFFVGGELALVRARQSRLTEMADRGDKLARIALGATRRIDIYLAVSQLGITVASLGLGWIGEPAVASAIAPWIHATSLPEGWLHPLSFALAFIAIAFTQIVLGELVPKNLAILHPETSARLVVTPFRALAFLARPFIILLTVTSNLVLRLFGQRLDINAERAHSDAELQLLLTTSEAHGHLDAIEQDLASKSLELGDITVAEIMIPRVAIAALSDSANLAEAQTVMLASGHDWLPVYHESRDDITGIIEWRSLFGDVSKDWQSQARVPLFLPESMSVSDALGKMMEAGPEMAVALDEYGGTAGLVTVRTLFEELTRRGQSWDPEMELPGRTSLRVIEELTGVELGEDKQVTTIGGLVTAVLGHFPGPGEQAQVGGWTITVVRGRRNQVDAVRLTPPKNEED